MRTKRIVSSVAALSLVVMPALANANPASSLSLSGATAQRAGAPMHARSNKLAGGSIVPVVLALAIVAGGVVLAVDGNHHPASP